MSSMGSFRDSMLFFLRFLFGGACAYRSSAEAVLSSGKVDGYRRTPVISTATPTKLFLSENAIKYDWNSGEASVNRRNVPERPLIQSRREVSEKKIVAALMRQLLSFVMCPSRPDNDFFCGNVNRIDYPMLDI